MVRQDQAQKSAKRGDSPAVEPPYLAAPGDSEGERARERGRSYENGRVLIDNFAKQIIRPPASRQHESDLGERVASWIDCGCRC